MERKNVIVSAPALSLLGVWFIAIAPAINRANAPATTPAAVTVDTFPDNARQVCTNELRARSANPAAFRVVYSEWAGNRVRMTVSGTNTFGGTVSEHWSCYVNRIGSEAIVTNVLKDMSR